MLWCFLVQTTGGSTALPSMTTWIGSSIWIVPGGRHLIHHRTPHDRCSFGLACFFIGGSRSKVLTQTSPITPPSRVRWDPTSLGAKGCASGGRAWAACSPGTGGRLGAVDAARGAAPSHDLSSSEEQPDNQRLILQF